VTHGWRGTLHAFASSALVTALGAAAAAQPAGEGAAVGAREIAPAGDPGAASAISDSAVDGTPIQEGAPQGGEPRSLDEAALVGPPAGRPLAGEELERATLELGSRMRCPVCQGLSIADSPSASALSMLAQVRDLLARGYTEEQVLDYFVRAYGEFVLLEPTAQGFNLVVWLAPLGAIALGALLIARRLRTPRGGPSAPGGPAGSGGPGPGRADDDLDPYLDRVRSEVGS
jgi:cytochrome c-type biogenesis protein CcmH